MNKHLFEKHPKWTLDVIYPFLFFNRNQLFLLLKGCKKKKKNSRNKSKFLLPLACCKSIWVHNFRIQWVTVVLASCFGFHTFGGIFALRFVNHFQPLFKAFVHLLDNVARLSSTSCPSLFQVQGDSSGKIRECLRVFNLLWCQTEEPERTPSISIYIVRYMCIYLYRYTYIYR